MNNTPNSTSRDKENAIFIGKDSGSIFSNRLSLQNRKIPDNFPQRVPLSALKRDPVVTKRGFAVEFPLLCAKLGSSVIPEVLVKDNKNTISKPTFPILGDGEENATIFETDSWLSGLSDLPTDPIKISASPTETFQTEGGRTDDLSLTNGCMYPSPVILIQYDTPENNYRLKSFSMRGVKADLGLIDALGLCLGWYSTLEKIVLKNCKLSSRALNILAAYMAQSKTIRELNITENPIPDESFNMILAYYTGLQHLTLRMCDITDHGAKLLASELTFRDPPEDKPLLSLNLSSNNIGDAGIKCLADALRTNRTLKSLILSQNNIGDTGAEALASIAMKFALKSDELQFRTQRNGLRKTSREHRIQELIAVEDASSDDLDPSKRRVKGRTSKKVREKVFKEFKYDSHPYVWDARPDGPNLWCVGNISLQKLGLGHNNIGVKGVKKILAALKYQNVLKKVEGRTEAGLKFVELEGNPIPIGLSEVNRLQELLTGKLRENLYAKHLEKVPKVPTVTSVKTTRVQSDHIGLTQTSTYMGFYPGASTKSFQELAMRQGYCARDKTDRKGKTTQREESKKRLVKQERTSPPSRKSR